MVFVDKIKEQISHTIIGQRSRSSDWIGMLCATYFLTFRDWRRPSRLKVWRVGDGSFQRIQFTPDLLPADIIEPWYITRARMIFRCTDPFCKFHTGRWDQSCPRQSTIGASKPCRKSRWPSVKTLTNLKNPFWYWPLKTRIEQEGTHPLPEAQVDRSCSKYWFG